MEGSLSTAEGASISLADAWMNNLKRKMPYQRGIYGIPTEIARLIFSFMTAEDVADKQKLYAMFVPPKSTTLIHFERRRLVNDLQAERLDVKNVFSKAFNDPQALLNTMLVSQSFLAGSRATDFFLPGAASQESDWNFYCTGTALSPSVIMAYLEGDGFRFSTADPEEACVAKAPESEVEEEDEEVEHDESDDDSDSTDSLPAHARKIMPTIAGVKVVGSKTYRITVSRVVTGDNIPNTVTRFETTAAQCYISGYEAVSLWSCWTRFGEFATVSHSMAPIELSKRLSVKKWVQKGLRQINDDGVDPDFPRAHVCFYDYPSFKLSLLDNEQSDEIFDLATDMQILSATGVMHRSCCGVDYVFQCPRCIHTEATIGEMDRRKRRSADTTVRLCGKILQECGYSIKIDSTKITLREPRDKYSASVIAWTRHLSAPGWA